MELKYRYYKDIIIDLHNKGYSPIQMEKEIPVRACTIKKWHNKLSLKCNKFSQEVHIKYHNIRFTEDDFLRVYQLSSSDLEIGNKLKISRRHVSRTRQRLNLPNKSRKGRVKSNESICLSKCKEGALIGCLLGDAYLIKRKNCNTSGAIAHSVRQAEYIKHKHLLFENISCKSLNKCTYTANKKNKHLGLRFLFLSNSYLDQFYDNLYVENNKVISEWIIERYTPVSLAYHFMDDGTKTKSGYVLCTYGFDRDSIDRLTNKLRKDFNLKTTIRKDKTIYIKKESVSKFNKLVYKHIIPSMKYKLHKS